MNPWTLTSLLLMYGLFEFLAAFSFNFKLKAIGKKKFVRAAALGAIATTSFVFLTSFSGFVAVVGGAEKGDMWWFILSAAMMMAMGNFCAYILIKPMENFLEKRKKKKEKLSIKKEGEE